MEIASHDLARCAHRAVGAPLQHRPHRLAEQPHLVAEVVDVVLARHPVANGLQQSSHRVAEDRPAAVGDQQGPCRVGADELEQDALARRRGGPTVGDARREHVAQHRVKRRRRQADVEEPRARERHLAHAVGAAKRLGQQLGDLTRRPLRELLQRERRVGREIAMLGALGTIDDVRRAEHGGRKGAVSHQIGEDALDQLPDMRFDTHGRSGLYRSARRTDNFSPTQCLTYRTIV